MTDLFNTLITRGMSSSLTGVQLKSIILVYAILCWAGALIYKLKYPRRMNYPFMRNDWSSVMLAPLLVPPFLLYFSITIVALNTAKTVIQFYKTDFAILFLAIIQFWQIIPNTPVLMKSRILGNSGLYWSHRSQIYLLIVFLFFPLIKILWKHFAQKNFLKQHKYLHLFIMLIIIVTTIAIFDMLLSQVFVSIKTFILSLSAIIIGGFIDQLTQGKHPKLAPLSHL